MSRPLQLLPCAALLLTASAAAQAPPRPQPTLIQNVALERGESAARADVVLRDGRIEAILEAGAPVPKGVRVVDGDGLLCLPAFVDAYTHTGHEAAEPVVDKDLPVDTGSDVRIDMRRANRKGIEPSLRVAEGLAIGEKESEAWRKAGFAVAHVAPGGQLLAGESCVASTREAAMRDLVIESDVYPCAGLRARGEGYPTTLMGYIAQLRQFFLDSQHHAELSARQEAGRPGPRPAFDPDLEAGARILAGDRRVLCETDSHRDVERWLKLSDAFGFPIAVAGGRDAWRVADELAAKEIPVLLTLDWGKEAPDPLAKEEEEKGKKGEDAPEEATADEAEPTEAAAPAAADDDEGEGEEAAEEIEWIYEEPLAVRQEKRREWEEGRDAALRLSEAGVPIAFGSGDDGPDDLLDRVRDLVEAGLPEDTALEALTSGAARLVGLEERVGKVAPGYDANLVLWKGDPLTDDKAQVRFCFVDGFPSEFEIKEKGKDAAGPPAEGLDASGAWTLVVESEEDTREVRATLEMAEDGSVTGTLEMKNPMDESDMSIDVAGQLSGSTLTFTGTTSMGDMEVEMQYELELDGDSASGTTTIHVPAMPEPIERPVEGTREPTR